MTETQTILLGCGVSVVFVLFGYVPLLIDLYRRERRLSKREDALVGEAFEIEQRRCRDETIREVAVPPSAVGRSAP